MEEIVMRRALLLVMLLSGCTVGPDYHPAPVSAQAGGALPYVPAVASNAAGQGDWWHLYSDAALDGLIAQALAANTDLRVAEANFDAARAVLRQSQAARLPSTTVSAGGTYGRSVTTTQIADAAGKEASDRWFFQSGFDMAYEVDLFGRVKRSIEASRADAQAAAAARDGVKITILAETVRDYVGACALGRQIDVARQTLVIAERQRDIVRAQMAAGGASDFDVARQETVVSRSRAVIPTLSGDRRALLFALAALLGRGPDGIPAVAAECAAIPQTAGPVPVGDGAHLLARRPDIRQAERRMAAASARIGVAKADLLPRITLAGSVSSIEPDLSALGSHGATSFGLGPLISWSFPNVAAAQARIRQARAVDQAAIATYDGTVLGALKEVEQALARYSAAVDRERELLAAQRQAGIAFDLAQARLNAGSISQLDMLVAQQALIDTQSAVAQAQATRADLLVSVFKALGGGW
jgi:NodT family efflux transporter outer membrane factor (OMF) lipoprotein